MAASTAERSSVICACRALMRTENSPCMERTAARAAAVVPGIDQVGDGFRLRDVDFAVQEGALTEFARSCHAAPQFEQPLHQQIDNHCAAMTLKFQTHARR